MASGSSLFSVMQISLGARQRLRRSSAVPSVLSFS